MIPIYEQKTPFSAILEANEQDEIDNIDSDVDDVALSGDVKEDFKKLIQQLRAESYGDLNDALDKICKDPKLYALLSKGFGNGDLASFKMSASTVSIPVTRLLPSQSEIGLEDSLKYPLKGYVDTYFQDPVTVVAPIVTFNKQWIVDGHHRWSQTFVANPEARITAINFSNGKISPIQCLRDVQGAIAVANGKVPSSNASSTNLYTVSESQLRSFIEKNITEESVQAFIKETNCENKDDVVEYLTANGMNLKKNNPPYNDAPERSDMPQTDEKSLDVMSKGVTNI